MDLLGKRVLMTGAGCLGRAVVRRLEGAALTVIDLSADALRELGSGVETRRVDITDPAAMKEAVQGIDIVIHTAAVLDGDADLMDRVNHGGTRTVAEAAADAGVGRLVHISSNAVYGINHTTDIFEDMGPSPSRQAYSLSKAAGEDAVRGVATETGLSFTIIRPAGIFGPGADYFAGSFYKRGRRKPVVFVGKGSGAMYCSFVDDVADLIAVAAVHPKAAGEVFNCVIDPPPTQREYMAAWSKLSGHDGYLGIPMPLAKFGGVVAKPFAKKGSYLSELNRNLDYVDRYVRIDASKARELLDWQPKHSLESGVEATVPWLRQVGLMDGEAEAWRP
jgi:nucleoside-diphosphate-sugar epimerase